LQAIYFVSLSVLLIFYKDNKNSKLAPLDEGGMRPNEGKGERGLLNIESFKSYDFSINKAQC